MSQLWGPSGRISVLAPVSTVTEAVAAVAAGASLVEVSDDDLIPAIRAATIGIDIDIGIGVGIGVGISGDGAEADLVREAALAARADVLICPDLDAAARAVQRGIAPEQILVTSAPDGIPAAIQAGWAVLADVDQGAATPAAAEAVAAVYTWLGVSVIRTRYITGVRRSVDMTQSMLGHRPPTRTLRGLA